MTGPGGDSHVEAEHLMLRNTTLELSVRGSWWFILEAGGLAGARQRGFGVLEDSGAMDRR